MHSRVLHGDVRKIQTTSPTPNHLAWRLMKNCIKLLIGRRTYFHDDDLFFRQYVFQLIGLRPIRKITCTELRSEGAASQALGIMNAITFARSSGLTYVHAPFSTLAHAERPMQEWAKAWEDLFNLGAGEVKWDGNRNEVVSYSYNAGDLELCLGWRGRRDELDDRFKATIPEFRRKYYLNKHPRMTEEVTVAVHVRRGDVSASDAGYFTGTDTILRTVTAVKSILDTHNVTYRIGVYSQGDSADFAELSSPGTELFINADAIWTMLELVEADVLIMAKGTFSYYAGLISDGIKICEPFKSPMDDWLLRSPDGSFDCEAFERQLSFILRAKAMAANKGGTGGDVCLEEKGTSIR
jgi:hypothetical protein